MTRRAVTSLLAAVALVATAAAYARVTLRPVLTSGHDFELTRRPAAKQLPEGFVLPASDVNLNVASLVAADLDADGDLDIVAADSSSGFLNIVVWVNDGAGKLTRKSPRHTGNFGSEPLAPSVDQEETTLVLSIQPNAPAIAAAGVNAWLTLPSRPRDLPASPDVPSAALSTLRSRSPPSLS